MKCTELYLFALLFRGNKGKIRNFSRKSLSCMRKFNSHSIPIRLNLLFAIVILLFMAIIGRFVIHAGAQ